MKPSFKKQIESVKGKWYYEDYKKYLKIKDDELIFDDDFKFKIETKIDEDVVIEEDKVVYFEGQKIEFKKGEVIKGLGEYHILTCNGEKISEVIDTELEDDGSNILETALLYIANCI